MTVDPETQRRIEDASAEALKDMPPMTAEECAAVARGLRDWRLARAREALRRKREAGS